MLERNLKAFAAPRQAKTTKLIRRRRIHDAAYHVQRAGLLLEAEAAHLLPLGQPGRLRTLAEGLRQLSWAIDRLRRVAPRGKPPQPAADGAVEVQL